MVKNFPKYTVITTHHHYLLGTELCLPQILMLKSSAYDCIWRQVCKEAIRVKWVGLTHYDWWSCKKRRPGHRHYRRETM